jgi:hypothetical protein
VHPSSTRFTTKASVAIPAIAAGVEPAPAIARILRKRPGFWLSGMTSDTPFLNHTTSFRLTRPMPSRPTPSTVVATREKPSSSKSVDHATMNTKYTRPLMTTKVPA